MVFTSAAETTAEKRPESSLTAFSCPFYTTSTHLYIKTVVCTID